MNYSVIDNPTEEELKSLVEQMYRPRTAPRWIIWADEDVLFRVSSLYFGRVPSGIKDAMRVIKKKIRDERLQKLNPCRDDFR